MNTSGVTMGGLFLEGLLSFFSPCVLPLLPLYIGYLTSGLKEGEKNHRLKTFLLTLCFVLGVSVVFFAAGLGSAALRTFFQNYTLQFQLFGGFLLLILGLTSLGVVRIPFLDREYRVNSFRPGKTGYLQAFLLGFFFSFAWSPCVGPLLASAMMTSATAGSASGSFLYISMYVLGFVLPFLVLGLFTDTVLTWLKNHRGIAKYTGMIGGAVVAGMGIYMLYQANTRILALQNASAGSTAAVTSGAEYSNEAELEAEPEREPGDEKLDAEKYNFTLKDIDGNEHSLTDYVGQPLLLNFFGTWCTYCQKEMPSLQKVKDQGDVRVVLIAAPHLNGEGDAAYVEKYIKDAGYDFEILYDDSFSVTSAYGISGYPTTFAMKKDGNFLGYLPGYMSDSVLDEVVQDLLKSE